MSENKCTAYAQRWEWVRSVGFPLVVCNIELQQKRQTCGLGMIVQMTIIGDNM